MWGGIDTGKGFFVLGCWSRVCIDGLLTRRWYLILPGCGGNSTPARDEALAARWLYEPQSVSHKGMQVGILHRAARHRSGARIFSSPGFWSCICIDGLPTRRWYLTSMGAAGSRRWLEGQLSQPAGSMSPSQSAVSGCRRGFQTVRGCVNPGEEHFSPWVVWFLDHGIISDLERAPYPRWMRRGLGVGPTFNSCSALALSAQEN